MTFSPESLRRAALRSVAAGLLLFAGLAAAAAVVLPAELRAVAWRDSNAAAFRLADVQAPLIVLTMGYTACRRVCGTTTLVLAELQRRLDLAQRPAEFIVVSFDPQNDSPQQWSEYRQKRGLLRSNWHFLSGSAPATHRLARYLDLDFWSYHDHIVHDFRIVVFDPQWRSIAEVDWSRMDDLPRMLGLPPERPPAPASMPSNP